MRVACHGASAPRQPAKSAPISSTRSVQNASTPQSSSRCATYVTKARCGDGFVELA